MANRRGVHLPKGCLNHRRVNLPGRFKALLFTYVARAAIASLLLGAGIRWLAQTTSISELMLNAVSLNAILDVSWNSGESLHDFLKKSVDRHKL